MNENIPLFLLISYGTQKCENLWKYNVLMNQVFFSWQITYKLWIASLMVPLKNESKHKPQ